MGTRIEVFINAAAAFFKAMVDRLLPSAKLDMVRVHRELEKEDQRLINFQGAYHGYQETPPPQQ